VNRFNKYFKNKIILLFGLISIISFQNSCIGVTAAPSSFQGTMSVQNENIWTNDQWQYYKVEIELGITVVVTLTYSGALDLDLYLIWKHENGENFNGLDLTLCPFESIVYDGFSQYRTNNTDNIGAPEELVFSNPTSLIPREAYILVLVFNGTGESTYTLSANSTMIEIDDSNVSPCEDILLKLGITIIGALIVLAIFTIIILKGRKWVVLTPAERKKKKEEKKQKEIEKREFQAAERKRKKEKK
jgi:hypothetical protein